MRIGGGHTRASVAAAIEATALGPGTSADDVRHLCAAALVHAVRGVVVPPEHVRVAVGEVAGSGLEVVTVAAFPAGTAPTAAKVGEVEAAAGAGADEVDVVADHPTLAAGGDAAVGEDLQAVVGAGHAAGLAVKVILETGALPPELVTRGSQLCVEAGADWVKTSTGFGPRGATVGDVRRIRAAVGDRAGVKAAGGIRTWDDAVALLDAGADAVGASSFVAILEGAPR
jgi:deoxyribose-phosphate aldolase